MSKPKPAAKPSAATPSTTPPPKAQSSAKVDILQMGLNDLDGINETSSGVEIARANVVIRMEMLRRRDYQTFLELRKALAAMPDLIGKD